MNEINFFKSRFMLGIIAPIILEIAVFEMYLWFAPKEEPTINLIFPLVIVLLPLFFIFQKTPNIIFYCSQMTKNYSITLTQLINDLLSQESALSPENRQQISQKLKAKFIPTQVSLFKQKYIESFFKVRISDIENLLTFYEWLFLFSFIAFIFNCLNLIGTLLLHFQSINLWILFIDQISEITNVIVFTGVFLVLILCSWLLLRAAIKGINQTLPQVFPILAINDSNVIIEESIERIKAFNTIISSIPEIAAKNDTIMTTIFEKTMLATVIEVVEWQLRVLTSKEIAWKYYSQSLDELNISVEQKKQFQDRFFKTSPLMKIAKKLTFDVQEFQNLQIDFNQARRSLSQWDVVSDAEKTMTYLFLYRIAETLLRNILRKFQITPEDWTLLLMLKALNEAKIITEDEFGAIDVMRRKRNTFLHATGQNVGIKKEEVIHMIEILEGILLRIEKLL